MSNTRILVTGVAGFIGSRIAKRLLEEGNTVIGIDSFDPYHSRVHKERNLADIKISKNFSLHNIDIRHFEVLKKIFIGNGIEKIAHLAAMAAVRYSINHPLVYGETNVQGVIHLLELAREHGNIPCVLASTGSVYGTSTPTPFTEDAPAMLPLAPYPASKRAMELFAHSFSHLHKLPVTILRFFNVYGPFGRADMMPWQWATKIAREEEIVLYNNGELWRDWTYIDDIVDGFCSSLQTPFPYEIINLGCGNPVKNARFVEILSELLGKTPKIRVEDPPQSELPITFASIEKAKKLLGYEPKVQVEEGLREFVQWMKSQELL